MGKVLWAGRCFLAEERGIRLKVERLGKYVPPKLAPPGLIVSSAVLQDGIIWTGMRHGNIIPIVWKETGKTVVQGQQGFWTDEGRFLRRRPAMKVAAKNGQLKVDVKKRVKLHSEDLW